MRNLLAIAWLAVSLSAQAQEVPGLDLSSPDKAKDAGDTTEVPELDLSKPAPPPPSARPEPAPVAKPVSGAPFSEKDVALGDKVKAVQRKGFLKRGRFEATPLFSATMNDAFYQKLGGGLRLAYNVQDSFAVALRGITYRKPELSAPGSWQPSPIRTDNAREGKIAFGGQLMQSQIYDELMLEGIWSPVYGKISFLQRQIIHFDVFLNAGLGLVWTATSYAPRNNSGLGPGPGVFLVGRAKYGADVGGGVRFYPKEWLALEVGLLATLYPDQPVQSLPATVQKVFAVNAGLSFFFPFTFDYVYP